MPDLVRCKVRYQVHISKKTLPLGHSWCGTLVLNKQLICKRQFNIKRQWILACSILLEKHVANVYNAQSIDCKIWEAMCWIAQIEIEMQGEEMWCCIQHHVVSQSTIPRKEKQPSKYILTLSIAKHNHQKWISQGTQCQKQIYL